MKKTDGHQVARESLNERRRFAVRLCLQGFTQVEAAALSHLSRGTVIRAMKAFHRGGWSAVDVKPAGRPVGSGRILSPLQEETMQRLIREHTPDELHLPYALWSSQAVRELVEGHCDVQLAARSMRKYLQRWGFTPQRPLKKAYEQSPEAVEQWVHEEYPKIAKAAQEAGAEILWGDETGLRSDDVRGRGYAPKGQTPVVRANANRAKLSVISTVTNKGEMRWKVFAGALNTKGFIDFLRRLVRGREQKIFLILDNLRVHHSKVVKEWVEENEERIALFYLPSYSPELNPDELLNADLKQRVTRTAPARSKAELTRTVMGALRSIQKQPERVQRYFHKKEVYYAA
jgi:transposase